MWTVCLPKFDWANTVISEIIYFRIHWRSVQAGEFYIDRERKMVLLD